MLERLGLILLACVLAFTRSAHLLFDALLGAYDSHMEQAQMRLAPIKPRSWRDIPRAGRRLAHRTPA
jgi:hypothetical protein